LVPGYRNCPPLILRLDALPTLAPEQGIRIGKPIKRPVRPQPGPIDVFKPVAGLSTAILRFATASSGLFFTTASSATSHVLEEPPRDVMRDVLRTSNP
jgi:hypothetical protein